MLAAATLKTFRIFGVGLIAFLLLFSAVERSVTSSAEAASFLRIARVISFEKASPGRLAGLTFSPEANAFLALAVKSVGGQLGTATEISTVGFFEEPGRAIRVPLGVDDAINMAFDHVTERLFLYGGASSELIEAAVGDNAMPVTGQVARVNVRHFGVREAAGMTVDPARGRLFILDGGSSRIVRVDPDRQSRLSGVLALRDGRVSTIELEGDDMANLRGIAFNPSNGHLYVVSPAEAMLSEITETGELVARFDLSEFGLGDPQGMVFASSGDQTDEASRLSLYLVDSGAEAARIIELAFVRPVDGLSRVNVMEAFLVQTIHTWQFEPPSPDSSGLTYLPDTGRLLVSDSEVVEMPIYDGANVFDVTLQGGLSSTFDTTAFSEEPTGIAYKPDGQRLFITDDNDDDVFEVSAGTDGHYGTADDIVTSFDTRDFGSHDPEGITYDSSEDRLFIVDGVNAEVYAVSPGPNGIFDGVDDEIAQFDTESIGILDPEGIAFNSAHGTLFLVGEPEETVAEVTTNGDLVQLIDISEANAKKPAGLAFAPRSNDASVMSLYIADRGVDNDSDPDENDGKVYEVGLDIAVSTATPTRLATSTPTITPSSPNATQTPTPTSMATGTPTHTPVAIPTTLTATVAPPGGYIMYLVRISGSSSSEAP